MDLTRINAGSAAHDAFQPTLGLCPASSRSANDRANALCFFVGCRGQI